MRWVLTINFERTYSKLTGILLSGKLPHIEFNVKVGHNDNKVQNIFSGLQPLG